MKYKWNGYNGDGKGIYVIGNRMKEKIGDIAILPTIATKIPSVKEPKYKSAVEDARKALFEAIW